MKTLKLALIAATLLIAACGSGPGTAPEPSSSPTHYNGDLPSGTSNDVFHGR